MKIILSRHANRRAKLYKIPESVISDMLTTLNLDPGEHEIIRDVAGFQYPLKIVVCVEGDIATVVTNYPLKKGGKK
jgi:hypothetical protein